MNDVLQSCEMDIKKAASGPRSSRNPASGFAAKFDVGERDPILGRAHP
jgi:hypothetical protein